MSGAPERRDNEDHLAYLTRAIPELISRAQQMKFDVDHRFDQFAVMLYASIIELANGAVRLIATGAPTGSRTLTRMALEALVDLTNLMNDESYLQHLEANNLKEWLKTFEVANEGNDFYKALADVPELAEQIEIHQAEFDALREKGIRPLKAFERFEKANMVDVYKAVYHQLCSDSHNSFSGLTARHIKINDDKSVEVHILRESSPEEHLHILDALGGFLISGSQLAHLRYGAGTEVVDDLEADLTAVRDRLQEARKAEVGHPA